MPSPSLHSDMMSAPPRPSVSSRSPTDTLISSASEADDLRRRISTPLHQEEDLELEEIDLDDALPMQQALPPDPEPSETVAPAPRAAQAHATEVEIPIEISVPPGATRLQLRLKLVLNLKQR